MKNISPLFAEERQQRIMNILSKESKIRVADLINTFQVSAATIRNDLRDLENSGKLKRTHGGAISIDKKAFEPTTMQKHTKFIIEKEKIAARAADFVKDGDTILIDTGTTTEKMVSYLANKKNLVVVVNDIRIAQLLEDTTQAQVLLIGGTLKRGFHCSTGSNAVNAISALNVEKVFIGTNAFSVEKGLTTPDINMAEVKKAMIKISSEVIVLCDSSKFGCVSFAQFASLEQINTLITDTRVTSDTITCVKKANKELDIIIV